MDSLILICVMVSCVLFILGFFLYVYNYTKNTYKNKISSLENDLSMTRTKLHNVNTISLSFKECNEIVDYITNDIWKNKYFINYRLRDLTMIPNMDDEITLFVKEVINSISNNVMTECLKYYSHDYLIKKITRTGQSLFIDYTNSYKPNTK